jgi:hypothetical protein
MSSITPPISWKRAYPEPIPAQPKKSLNSLPLHSRWTFRGVSRYQAVPSAFGFLGQCAGEHVSMLLGDLDVTSKCTKACGDGVTCALFDPAKECACYSRLVSGKRPLPASARQYPRIRFALGVVALTAWSSGCALPCLALHNVQVEMRENLDEQMAGIRQWWQGKPIVLHAGPRVGIQDPESGRLVGGVDRGAVDGPVTLPPPSPVHGDKPSQAGER